MNESTMTGEQRPIEIDAKKTPFLTSGAKVVDGYGRMLVTAVGKDTAFGDMMSSTMRQKTDPTPIQERLQDVKSIIGRVGSPSLLIDRQHVTIIQRVRWDTASSHRRSPGPAARIDADALLHHEEDGGRPSSCAPGFGVPDHGHGNRPLHQHDRHPHA